MRHIGSMSEDGGWESTISEVVRDWDQMFSSGLAKPTPVLDGPDEIAATVNALHAAADTLRDAADELAKLLPKLDDETKVADNQT